MRRYIIVLGFFTLLFSGCKMFQIKEDVAKVSSTDETPQTQQVSSEPTKPPEPAFKPSPSTRKT
ncbi:MAG TPA: hypothetical protein PKW86_01360, partial [bacterium]|nr:hypothetical protein [bacterium]HOL34504.1 hypothetical protein [bacterium]